MEITRHFTSSVFIVCNSKVLLCFHKKLKKWLPVGGHIERDELPQEAALREVKEESGLDVELYCSKKLSSFSDVKELIPPATMYLEDINEFHQHIDFIYYAKIDSENLEQRYVDEFNLRWFELEELKNTPDLPKDVVVRGEEAVKILNSS